MPQTITREYAFEADSTCKTRWVFRISQGADGPVIEDLQVHPHRHDDGSEAGCSGHHGTIMALMKGRPVKSVWIEGLMGSPCGQDYSCAQALAVCLKKILDETEAQA